MKPVHEHDCDACVHVTTMYVPGNGNCDEGRWYDIYYCEDGHQGPYNLQYVARYGVEEHYESLFRRDDEGLGVGEPSEQEKEDPSVRSWR